MPGPEATIERRIRERALRELGVFVPKLVVPGETGFPDRFALVPGGRPVFMEIKRPGRQPDPKQDYWLERLRKLGYYASWFDDVDMALEEIQRRMPMR